MADYKYVISQEAFDKIDSFYENVALKYVNTYSFEKMEKNILDAYRSIYKIENGLLRRRPTLKRWKGYYMANTKKWYYAYTINDDTITVVDACHSQNMHESKKSISMIISEVINNYLRRNIVTK